MADVQFNRYNNIVIFAKEWRKYKMPDKPLDANAFRNEMQTEQYVKLNCVDTKKNREVLIYLFDRHSKYSSSSQDLKRLLNKIKHPCDVILITYESFNIYGRKAISSFKHLNIYTYPHEIFEMVLPNGPLCYPHRILSHDEVLKLCNEDLMCYLTNLPKILDEDPQCVWIGATSGDVVEITLNSDISGEFIQYRVVSPKSGRVIFAKESSEEEKPTAEPVDLDVDEELEEHRELNAPEDEIEEVASDEEDA